MDVKGNLYNVAIGGQGYILQGTPTRPARKVVQAPIFGTRFASGDRDYNDFTFWWYWAQKDWSGGIKNNKSWQDDAKYYFSTNVDVFDEYGTIKLAKEQTLVNEFTEDILCGNEGEINPPPQHTPLLSPNSNRAITGQESYAWTNPQNAYTSNDVYATASAGDQKRHCWYNFSVPTIPSGATILGIEVLVEAKKTADPSSVLPYLSVGLTKNANDVAGYEKSTPSLTFSDEIYTLGSQNDLWGTTWSPSDFGVNFGVIIETGVGGSPSIDYAIDHIQVRVYYKLSNYVSTTQYIGTNENQTSSKPVVYRWTGTSWTNITDSIITTTRDKISQILIRNGLLWILTTGTSNSNVVLYWDGSSFTDNTSNIKNGAVLASTFQNAYCACEAEGHLYIAVNNPTLKYNAIVRTSESFPTINDWTKVLEEYTNAIIIDICYYNGLIYYLLYEEPFCKLRFYNPSDDSTGEVFTFKNISVSPVGLAGKLLINFRNSLIITMPPNEIWKIEGGVLQLIFKRDNGKQSLLLNYNNEIDFDISKGGVVSDNKVFWGNLIYDGAFFSNWIKPLSDDGTKAYYPVFVDKQDNIWGISSENSKKIYKQTSNYKKGNVEKNYLIFSEIDTISTIDKLFNKVNIIFEPLSSGQKIQIWYSTDSGKTWQELGGVSYSVDGGNITNKTLSFPDNTISKKMMIKVGLEDESGSATPIFKDISIAYYPLPYYKQRWDLTINCIDNLMLLDGKTKEAKRGEELRNILKTFWKNREIVEFQDIDFAETKLNGSLSATDTEITVDSTNNFPEQGIIRIDNEKVKYTGKTANKFTGCIRGYDGTIATSHEDGSVCSNSYKVIITNYAEITPVGTKSKVDEFLVGIQLMEI